VTTSYVSLAELAAWADREADWPTLIDHLGRHCSADERIYGLLPRLRATPALTQALLAALPAWSVATLRAWLGRTPLAPDATSAEAFLALASARARLRDPTFPIADPTRLTHEPGGYCCYAYRSDQRDAGGRGWSLYLEERDVGPAEAIHESEWRASAHGLPDGTLRLHRLASGGMLTRMYEEFAPG
jgi:hypothetical protein